MPTDAAVPRVGGEVAGYRLESLLGRGGMGTVYVATQLRLGREVALKLLAHDLADDSDFRARFIRESELAASLEHPNVITIYDADEADGLLFIAMRYIRGGDLRRVLADRGPLSLAETISIADQVAGGLDAAHAVGLVHRDVK